MFLNLSEKVIHIVPCLLGVKAPIKFYIMFETLQPIRRQRERESYFHLTLRRNIRLQNIIFLINLRLPHYVIRASITFNKRVFFLTVRITFI